jgi:hypothetical protein
MEVLASFVLVGLATGSCTSTPEVTVSVMAEGLSCIVKEVTEEHTSTIKKTCACNGLRLVDNAKEYKCDPPYIHTTQSLQESKRNQRGIIFHIRSRSFAAHTSSARAQDRHSDTSALFSAPSSSATYSGSAYPRSRSQT